MFEKPTTPTVRKKHTPLQALHSMEALKPSASHFDQQTKTAVRERKGSPMAPLEKSANKPFDNVIMQQTRSSTMVGL